MKENETTIKINRALERYQKLLDHHNIGPRVQEAIWGSVLKSLETDRQGTIRQIDGWWEEAFGPNGRNEEAPTETNPDLQKVFYQSRREQWRRYRKTKGER